MIYAIGRVETVKGGCIIGWIGFFCNVLKSPFQLYTKADRFARSHGAFGCLWGLVTSPFFIIKYILKGLIILFDSITVGICNGCFGTNKLSLVRPGTYFEVHSVADKNIELQMLAMRGMSNARKQELFRGLDMAVAARKVFDEANPKFPDHWHYYVAEASDLKVLVPQLQDSYLKLSDSECAALSQMLGQLGDEILSFSMFCVLIRRATLSRPNKYAKLRARKSRRPSLAEIFLTEDEVEQLTERGLNVLDAT